MAMFAAVAAMAGQQIAQGIASNNEAKYNAGLFAQKAQNIELQKSLEGYQYDRAFNQLQGTGTARTAKSGFLMSGSPMAAMIDRLTQIQLDKSIGAYNLDVERAYAQSAEKQTRRKGKMAMYNSFSNAFSTLLKGGFDYGMGSGAFTPKNTATISGMGTVPVKPYF